jgi:hypothetical protein
MTGDRSYPLDILFLPAVSNIQNPGVVKGIQHGHIGLALVEPFLINPRCFGAEVLLLRPLSTARCRM